ncbi:DedA family protein [Brevibacterium luteolum]|uniref:DedA family protein n=1 Tax=Brevibacterium luteolum TaxID=199591 RepID=A0A6G8KWH4_9MICO|nr:VTT domain-containing protein [Brevibacterium luteolum]MBU8578496.1 DedA family protein [Brevibacterium luteolum]QIN29152.1 DedA family protein [Brevibacterium luteolum]
MTDEQHPLPHHRREPETEAPAAEPQTQAETPPAQPQSFKDLAPWEGEATIVDKLLLVGVFGVPLFYLVLLPFRPQLIANHPVLLEFLTGAKSAIVGAGAYAGIGELSLTLVFIAGLVGMAKFDWMFWLAGRRWGDGAVNLFAQSERQRKRFSKLKNLPAWLLFIFVFISRVPGIPGTIVWLVAGYSRMSLPLFLTAQISGAAAMTAVWTALGYNLGQAAVDVIQVIDRYAMWISLAIIVGIVVWSTAKSVHTESKRAKAAGDTEDSTAGNQR